MSVIDDLLSHNRQLPVPDGPARPAAPSSALAVLTCMDARLDVLGALGLAIGQAHILRNAGGLPTPDTLRSLAISQRKLGTSSVMVIQHTQCGMAGFDDPGFRSELAGLSGSAPSWDVPGFADLEESVRRSVREITDCPWLPHRSSVRGFAFDIGTAKLSEVS